MPRTFLVLHGGALGDCVLAIHFARAIRDVAPPLVGGAPCHTLVTVAARSSIARWAVKHELIDAALPLDAFLENPTRFDVVVSLLGGPDEPVSVPFRAGFDANLICIDPRPDEGSNLHIVEQWLSKLDKRQSVERKRHDEEEARRHGKAMRRFRLGRVAGARARSDARALERRIGSTDRPIVLIHPGSGGLSKCIPIETLAPLFSAFRDAGWVPAWMIGPDERERFGAPYERQLAETAPVIYEESVLAAADLIAGADAYIGMDAGMTHVAALAGVNTVALFGPTNPEVWRPIGRSVQVLPFAAANRPIELVERVTGVAHP